MCVLALIYLVLLNFIQQIRTTFNQNLRRFGWKNPAKQLCQANEKKIRNPYPDQIRSWKFVVAETIPQKFPMKN